MLLFTLLEIFGGEIQAKFDSNKQPPVICGKDRTMTKTDDGWKCLKKEKSNVEEK